MSFDFQADRLTPFGERAAAAAIAALQDGPIGLFWRRDVARAFQACGEDVDLSGTKTTCGVFASACWYWAGRRFKIPRGLMTPHGHIGGALVGSTGWLEIGSFAFVKAGAGQAPEVGDIFCYGPSLAATHHVDICVEVRADGQIRRAHGGGSPDNAMIAAAHLDHDATIKANGTVAVLGAFAPLPHDCCGWFSARAVAQAEHLDASVLDVEAKTDPAPPLMPHEIENDPAKAT